MAGTKAEQTLNGIPTIMDAVESVIAKHPNVVLCYLFGSQVHGNVGPLSDIDIAFLLDKADEADKTLGELRSEIASAIGQERVDVVFLNRAPVELAYAVIAHGALTYQRDVYTRVEYEAKIMSLYCDYLPVLRAQRDDLLRGDQHETRVQRYREALGRTERTLGALRSAQG
jgi:predicted nucleotidyltransferase